MTKNVFLHGSRSDFTAFDPYQIGMGAEPNSSFGIWVTTNGAQAAGYGGKKFVHVVETGPLKLISMEHEDVAIWGRWEHEPASRQLAALEFANLRQSLMAQGYDGAMFFGADDSPMEGALCLFRPEALRIVKTISDPEEIEALEWDNPARVSNVEVDHDMRLEDLMNIGPDPDAEIDLDELDR